MSLIKKLKRITIGRIEAFLDSLEDPAYIMPQLQKELAGQLELAIKAQAKSLSVVKSMRRKLDETEGKLARLEKLAPLAIANDDQALARKILSAQIQTEQEKQALDQQWQEAEKVYLQTQQVCTQLAGGINNLKQKARELKSRQELTRQLRQAQAYSGTMPDSIIDAIAAMEEKTIEQESQVQIRNEIAGLFLEDDRLENLEKSAEVEQRLAELKERCKKD